MADSLYTMAAAALRTRPLPQPTASSLVVERAFSLPVHSGAGHVILVEICQLGLSVMVPTLKMLSEYCLLQGPTPSLLSLASSSPTHQASLAASGLSPLLTAPAADLPISMSGLSLNSSLAATGNAQASLPAWGPRTSTMPSQHHRTGAAWNSKLFTHHVGRQQAAQQELLVPGDKDKGEAGKPTMLQWEANVDSIVS
jgi:hypothetical protein